MRTIALRFADNFAPDVGTIAAHEEVLQHNNYVWYGKLGSAVSRKVIDEILQNDNPKILLIHSGKTGRYWAYVEDIQHGIPEREYVPDYYRERVEKFNTWFKVTRFEAAPNNVLSKCIVASSHRLLSEVSRSSMSPYFIIEVEE